MGIIYRAVNTITQESYIGQTNHTLAYRWNQHITDNRRENYKLQKALQKYGPNVFSVEVLEDIPNATRELMYEREQYWIKYYDSFRNGYNGTMGGAGSRTIMDGQVLLLWNKGMNYSEISDILRCCKPSVAASLKILGLYNTHEAKSRGKNNQKKAVWQYTLDGTFIREFDSTSAAASNVGVDRTAISLCVRGKAHTIAGYKWSYAGENIPIYSRHKMEECHEKEP